MQHVESIVISAEMRTAVTGLVARLGRYTVVADVGWTSLTRSLSLETSVGGSGLAGSADASLVVGPPARLLKHAAAETNEFGFIVPVAQLARWWQRTASWRDDTMLDLWQQGWTPVAIDRIVTAKQDAGVEFVIGNARPTPTLSD